MKSEELEDLANWYRQARDNLYLRARKEQWGADEMDSKMQDLDIQYRKKALRIEEKYE